MIGRVLCIALIPFPIARRVSFVLTIA
jgi:hypothetical protein